MQVGAESARPSRRAVLWRAQVGPRVPPCDSLGKRCSSSRAWGWGALVQGPDRPLSGDLGIQADGQPAAPHPSCPLGATSGL